MFRKLSAVVVLLLLILGLAACQDQRPVLQTDLDGFEYFEYRIADSFADITPSEGNRLFLVYIKPQDHSDPSEKDLYPYFVEGGDYQEPAVLSDGTNQYECLSIGYQFSENGRNAFGVLLFDVPADLPQAQLTLTAPNGNTLALPQRDN
ncbi:MAG: hypothetical protein ACOYI4_05170 [Christensenellales bacterium]|jgi:hypothetical protein